MAKSRPQGAGYTEASEAFLEEKIPTETVPGLSVAVVKGGRIIWNRGFGFADLATSTPATPQTSYLWFSMTKIVTATAVLQLVQREISISTPRPTSTFEASRSYRSRPP